MKRYLVVIVLVVDLLVSHAGGAVTSDSPGGDIAISTETNSREGIAGVIIRGKSGVKRIHLEWDWSPDVIFKWITNDIVILCQKNLPNESGKGYNGLCAVIDVAIGKLLFFDHVQFMYADPLGTRIVYLAKIGRRVAVEDYDHSISIVDLKAIVQGTAPPPLTWNRRQEEINAGKFDFRKSDTPAKITISPAILGEPENMKTFLLAPPVFAPKEKASMLVGLGKTVNDINMFLIVSKDLETQKVTSFEWTTPFPVVDLSVAARSLDKPLFSLTYDDEGFHVQLEPR